MDILYIAIPMALGIAGFFVVAFLWSVSNGQLDDLETPAVRMLFDDEPDFGVKASKKLELETRKNLENGEMDSPAKSVSEM